MSSNTKNKNSLFLIELIMVIFFFSIMSAICVSIFAKSYSLSNKSNSIDKALVIAQNAAECLKNSDGTFDILNHFFTGKQQDTSYQVFYNDTFEMIESEQQATYELNISLIKQEKHILTFSVSFINRENDEDLIQLTVKKYQALSNDSSQTSGFAEEGE